MIIKNLKSLEDCLEIYDFINSELFSNWKEEQTKKLISMGYDTSGSNEFAINKIDPYSPHSVLNSTIDKHRCGYLIVTIKDEELCEEDLEFLNSSEFKVWLEIELGKLSETSSEKEEEDTTVIINKIEPSKPHSSYNSRLDPVQE